MKPISFAVGLKDWPEKILGVGDFTGTLNGLFKNGLHVDCNSEEIPNVSSCKMNNSHVECYEECGKSKYKCDCTVTRLALNRIKYTFNMFRINHTVWCSIDNPIDFQID